MAVVFMDGFDDYPSSSTSNSVEYVKNGWTYNNQIGNTRTGTRFATNPGRMTDSGYGTPCYLEKKDLVASATMTVGWAMYIQSSSANNQEVFYAYDDTTYIIHVVTDASGHLVLYNSSAAIVATSTEVLNVANGWNYIEIVITVTTGAVDIYVDGVSWISETGVTMASATTCNGVRIYVVYDGRYDSLDDVYITNDTTKLDAPRIISLLPTGDGTTTDWTGDPDDTTPYTNLDNATNTVVDTDFISTETANDQQQITYADLPTGTWSVHAVQPKIRNQVTTAGTPTISVTTNDGATETGITVSASTKYTSKCHIHANGSAGGWSQAQVNALELTVEYE